jgi:hypothetical protein
VGLKIFEKIDHKRGAFVMAMIEKKVKSKIPIYAVGLVWVEYVLFFKLYRWTDFFVATALSAIVYIVLNHFIPDKKIMVHVPNFEKSGDKTTDNIVAEGNGMLKELSAVRAAIRHPRLIENIVELHKTGTEIYAYIAKNPASAPLIKKFHTYYFPETLKILKTYDDIDDFESGGKNIEGAKAKIENIALSMTDAFKKQLDNLLHDKTFDVRTDIKVLETLLKEEGLSNEKDG